MTLREKFLNVWWFSEKQMEGCVIVADNYAEEFGKWLRENDDKSLMISELLELFIKEKRL